MKKTNFLKGVCAKLALAVVAFGAMVTSCTKEEFNVTYKPNNAKVIFQPTVIDAASNTVVTNATFSYTGNEAVVNGVIEGKEGNSIAAGSVVIEATVDGITGKTTANYPEVAAGSVVTCSPIIVLSFEFELKQDGEGEVKEQEIIEGNGVQGHSHNGYNWNYNMSEYFAEYTASWEGEFTLTAEATTTTSSAALNAFIAGAIAPFNNGEKVEIATERTFKASAWSMYRADAIISALETNYNVISKDSNSTVATIKVTGEPKVEIKHVEDKIPGHESHYQLGHGHDGHDGHGGNANAGGGITWAE